MASMAVQITGLDKLLEGMGKTIDFTPALKGIKTTILVPETQLNFQGQHDPDGMPWAPLKKPRRRKRDLVRGSKRGRAKKGVDQILLDTGIIRASMTGQVTKSSDNASAKENRQTALGAHIEEMTGDSLEWGTVIDYGHFHQEGTKKMVARPFLGINTQMENDMAELVSDFIVARLT